MNHWLQLQLQNSSDALWLLKIFLGTMRQTTSEKTVYVRRLSIAALDRFSDSKRIEERTSNLDIDKLGRDDRRALKAFRHALIWKAQGQEDGYYGENGDSSPLAEES